MPAICALRSCSSRYRKKGSSEKRHHFKVPSDPDLLKQWRSLTCLRNLKSTDFLCYLHFDPGNIITENVYIINGREVRAPRGKWTLKPGTLPSILLDDSDAKASSHSKTRRKLQSSLQSNTDRATQTTSLLFNNKDKQTSLSVDRYDTIPVPCCNWRWVHFQDHEETWQCVELVAGQGGIALIRKLAVVKPSKSNISYFVCGQEYRGPYLNNSYSFLEQLHELLVGFHNLKVCTGPKGPTASCQRTSDGNTANIMLIPSQCRILTKNLDRLCNECRYCKKYLLNKKK